MTTRRDAVYNGKTRTYATRNAKGEFVERVTHKRSSRQDQLRTTVAEAEARVVRAAMKFTKLSLAGIANADHLCAQYDACRALTAARKSARAAKRKKAVKSPDWVPIPKRVREEERMRAIRRQQAQASREDDGITVQNRRADKRKAGGK